MSATATVEAAAAPISIGQVKRFLAATYPGAFSVDGPLAIGTEKDLHARHPEIPRDMLRKCMWFFSSRLAYQAALSAGKPRLGLDGAEVCTPSDQHQAGAMWRHAVLRAGYRGRLLKMGTADARRTFGLLYNTSPETMMSEKSCSFILDLAKLHPSFEAKSAPGVLVPITVLVGRKPKFALLHHNAKATTFSIEKCLLAKQAAEATINDR